MNLIASNVVDEFSDDGFGDELEDIQIVKVKKTDKKYDIYGSLTSSAYYNYQKNIGISSLKLSANIKAQYKINDNMKIKSTLKAYNDFKTDIKDDYDIDINELYIQKKLKSKVDVTIGRQIVVWGKSDNIRITDNLNPIDYTTPALTDIKDLRLGRFMGKFDYRFHKWDLSAIVLKENRYSSMPQEGSEYYNAKAKFPNPPTNIGFAFSASKNLQGQDISFYALNQYIDNTTYKSNMIGMAYNIVKNNFLFKTEFAYFDNYDNETIAEKYDGLMGVEYNGISDGSISLEIANKDKDIQYALRFTQSYINQTLDFSALYNGYGQNLENGGFARVWLDYDIDDKFTTSFGIVDYIDGDKPNFKMIKEQDKIFANMVYNF
jgi:hypothetical protein